MCIGLDGATFDIIDPLLRENKLPNLKRIIGEGSRGYLRSVISPFSPQAWSSFMTGVNPGKHGVFGFREKINNSYSLQFVNNQCVKSKTLWKVLSESGKKVIVINIPMTYPPEKVNGILIGGMDSPGIASNFTYPPEVKSELLKIASGYTVHLHVAGYLDSDAKRRKALTDILRMTEYREKAVLYFMKKYDWDFFAVNFSATDQTQHHFWKYMINGYNDGQSEFKDAIAHIYQRLDETIGKIVTLLDDSVTLFIMSDHGSGPVSDVVFYIDEWLKRNGLLKFKEDSPSVVKGFVAWLKRFLFKRLSSRSKDVLLKLFPAIRGKIDSFIERSSIDWKSTRVFSGEHAATLRINLKGREPNGIVEAGNEYETLRNWVIRELEVLEHPVTKERLIEKVYKREELYQGPYLETAPDLLIWRNDSGHRILRKVFRDNNRPVISTLKSKGVDACGTHTLYGIFVAKGTGIRKGVSISTPNIFDLFPTILHSLQLPIPRAIDGKVITEMYDDSYLKANPVKYIDYDIKRHREDADKVITYKDSESMQIE
ncbi:MAG TPA: alkaline phosphatase family protein, partial [Candidatus Brocadiales bacterium]|nr:alkaline phosphatase family protein [Candidatus Brocadiales bacterium]